VRWLFRRSARIALAVALLVFVAVWTISRHVFAHDTVRGLPWLDLTNVVGPLTFPRATTRELPGPKTFALYLRLHKAMRRVPPPDFKHGIVLVVAVGPRSSTAYSLQVLRVTEQRSRVIVKLRENTATTTNPGQARVTYPYRMITFPKTHKPTFVTIRGRP
jgi:hypothetical protein